MSIPAAPSFASFDVTPRTEGRSVNAVLWDAMFAKSRLLEVIGTGPKINHPRHEWISLAAPATHVTVAASDTTFTGSATLQACGMSAADIANVQPGTLLVNATRATPIGTHRRNEILQVASIAGNVATLTRDAGTFHTGGSTAHATGDLLRILDTPLQEGSSAAADPNKYSADSILENYTSIRSMKLQLTGSQAARDMEVVAKELERQYARELIQMKNIMAQMLLYGYNSATAVGNDSVIRYTKGIQDFMVDNIVTTNALVDFTTTTLSADAINALFLKLWANGADPSEPYKIVTSGVSKQVIGSWAEDKSRTTFSDTDIGRETTVFRSDLGFTAEVIADPVVDKNNLFIIQPNKIKVIPFRPFEKEAWGKGTSAPNGDDMYYQRTLGEFTVEILDPGTAHACVTSLTWI